MTWSPSPKRRSRFARACRAGVPYGYDGGPDPAARRARPPGRRLAQDRYAFGIDCRGDDPAGGIRQIWELSRLHHLTLLATAWFLTHDERYARTVADHLGSWWRENTFLSGVNWTSGAELGI